MSNTIKLRHPYEYILPVKRADKHYGAMKAFINSHSKDKFWGIIVDKKAVSLGFRFRIWFHVHPLGQVSPTHGCTKQEWNNLIADTQKLLTKMLGKKAKLKYDAFKSNDSFSAGFETYIAYKELVK